VEELYGITCSVGVAPTKFLAKLASGMCKPDGFMVVPKTAVLDFLHPLPVSALWGVGKKTAEQLDRVGLESVGAIAATPLPRLRKLLGVALAEHLFTLAQGFDDRAVVPESKEKSIGAEETFEVDHFDRVLIKRELLRLAERSASQLRAKGLRSRTVSIKVRFSDFSTITRSRTLQVPTDLTHQVYATSCTLLDDHVPDGAVRLIGVRLEQLVEGDSGEQLMFDAPERGWREAEQAADQARSKFGLGGSGPRRSSGRSRVGRGRRNQSRIGEGRSCRESCSVDPDEAAVPLACSSIQSIRHPPFGGVAAEVEPLIGY
jgi:DNA polymerase-4